MNLKEQLDALLDATAFDSTGTKIGAVRQVYVDDSSGKVTFATVATGIFSADAIVPLHGARLLDNELHVDHTRDVVRDSPRPDHTEDTLTPEQENKLLEYFGIEAPSDARSTDASRGAAAAGAGAGAGAGAAGRAAAGAAGKGKSTSKDSTPKDKGADKSDRGKTTGTDTGPTDKSSGAPKTPSAPTTSAAPKTPSAPTTSDAKAEPTSPKTTPVAPPTSTGAAPRDQTAQSTPTTRETSPIAAPKAMPKNDPGEKNPTTTTTKPSTPGAPADSGSTANSSGSVPADSSPSAAEKARGTGGSPSRD